MNQVTLGFELQKPTSVVSLATSAVLVSIDVNIWSATKQDRVISSEVTSRKKAVDSAGKFTKNLLAGNQQHKDLHNYRQTIYNWLKRKTFRWNDSQDLLPVIDLETFKAEYNDHEKEFYRLLDNFMMRYQSIVSDMAFAQGDMFNRDDYPIPEQVRAKFGINLYVSEVPSHDFRCQISNDIASDLKQQYEQQAERIVENVLSQQITRITEVMESISHCCGEQTVTDTKTGETKTKKRKIYDTTITKAKELCKTFQGFSPVSNEQSDRLLEVVKRLSSTLNGVDIESLRDSDVVRDKVKSDVDDILSKFKF